MFASHDRWGLLPIKVAGMAPISNWSTHMAVASLGNPNGAALLARSGKVGWVH